MDEGEQVAIDFLASHGLWAVRFAKHELRQGKTPDFRVFNSAGGLVLYCEAKRVQYDEWLDKQLKTAKPLAIVGGARPDPVFNRLCGHIHNAAKQFAAVNPKRELPNVLVLTNSDSHCTFHGDLIGVLTGNFYGEGGVVDRIYGQYAGGRIKQEKLAIDLYVWCDRWDSAQREPRRYFWRDSPHYGALCKVLNSDPAAHRKVS